MLLWVQEELNLKNKKLIRIMKTIILISGRSGSGKDTCSSLMVGWKRYAFADHLKDLVSERYNVNRKLCDTQEGKKSIVFSNKSLRDLLIEDGLVYKKDNSNFFIDILAEKIKNDSSDHIVVTDFRFPNEYFTLKDKLSKENIKTLNINRNLCNYIDDSSETSLDTFVFDYTIENNGTLQDLERKLKIFS